MYILPILFCAAAPCLAYPTGARAVQVNFLGADPFFVNRRDQIISSAARGRVPGVYFLREFAESDPPSQAKPTTEILNRSDPPVSALACRVDDARPKLAVRRNRQNRDARLFILAPPHSTTARRAASASPANDVMAASNGARSGKEFALIAAPGVDGVQKFQVRTASSTLAVSVCMLNFASLSPCTVQTSCSVLFCCKTEKSVAMSVVGAQGLELWSR
jgi:hypothetical protein